MCMFRAWVRLRPKSASYTLVSPISILSIFRSRGRSVGPQSSIYTLGSAKSMLCIFRARGGSASNYRACSRQSAKKEGLLLFEFVFASQQNTSKFARISQQHRQQQSTTSPNSHPQPIPNSHNSSQYKQPRIISQQSLNSLSKSQTVFNSGRVVFNSGWTVINSG